MSFRFTALTFAALTFSFLCDESSVRCFFLFLSSLGKAVSTQDPAGSSLCLPCQDGCGHCKDDTPCVAHGEGYLRIAVLAFQGICMLLDFISMVLLYHFRRNKVLLRPMNYNTMITE